MSARNRAKGRVKRAKPGVVTAGVDLEIPAGGVITSVITKRSAETMGL